MISCLNWHRNEGRPKCVQVVNHCRLHWVMATFRDNGLLVPCTTYSCDVSSFRWSCRGHQVLTCEFVRTRSSCSWLFSSRMWCLDSSATITWPVMSVDKCIFQLTSVNVDNVLPLSSISLTYMYMSNSHTIRQTRFYIRNKKIRNDLDILSNSSILHYYCLLYTSPSPRD